MIWKELVCDNVTCRRVWSVGDDAAAMRSSAKQQGWVYRRTARGMKDYCRECAAAPRCECGAPGEMRIHSKVKWGVRCSECWEDMLLSNQREA